MITKVQRERIVAQGVVTFLEDQAVAARNEGGASSLLRMVVIDSLLGTARDDLQDAKLRELFNVS